MTQTKIESKALEMVVSSTAKAVLDEFADSKIQDNDLAFSLIDLTCADKPQQAAFRGDEPFYPASVVKLFHLVAAHRWLEDGLIEPSEELDRALANMIIESSNNANSYVIDVVTGTSGGPELPAHEMAIWQQKRNIVNEYFASQGYLNINVNQKTWDEGPYGRERLALGKGSDNRIKSENRNKLTTNITAKLLSEIATGKCVTSARSEAMMQLLKRDFKKASDDPDDQATKFTGVALPDDAKLWSKAGWMSTARHDAAYVELGNGVRFVLVIFVSNHAKEYGIIPSIARRIIDGLGELHEGPYTRVPAPLR